MQILRAVARTGSFTKAAEHLYLTQSAVSHAVKELEEEAGTLLFERLKKCVRITESGRMLLEESLPLLSSFQALEGRLGRLECQAPIRIVSSITIASFWLPRLLRRFSSACPQTPVEVEVVSAGEAMAILREGGADLALVEGAVPLGAFRCVPFASYRLAVVCAPGYRPAGEALTLRELCADRLLLRQKGSAIRDTFDSAVLLSGLEPRPVWTSINSTALIEAAKAGLGITILPDLLVQSALEAGSLVELRVRDLSLHNDLNAVRRRDRYESAPLAALLRLIGQGVPEP